MNLSGLDPMVRLLRITSRLPAADCVVGFRHDGRVPIERLDLLGRDGWFHISLVRSDIRPA